MTLVLQTAMYKFKYKLVTLTYLELIKMIVVNTSGFHRENLKDFTLGNFLLSSNGNVFHFLHVSPP